MKDARAEMRGALRCLPYLGVVAKAEKLGFSNGDPDWINLGQGQPKVGSDFDQWMRFSFAPDFEAVETGLDRLKAMLKG